MNRITRWTPMNEMLSLRDAMDRWFDDAWRRPLNLYDGWTSPQVDMYETDDSVIVNATMPGFEAEDIDISVAGDVLTIRAEHRREEETRERNYHLRERHFGTMSRSLTLPTIVKADDADAEFKNGVLHLTLPKTEEVRPQLIDVKAK